MLISSSSRREFFVFVERCVEDIATATTRIQRKAPATLSEDSL
jgi:hypothetical protein